MSSSSKDISYRVLENALQKEQEQGYQDAAVPGGLENFVEDWWRPYKVMHPDLAKWRAGISAALQNYRQSSIEERQHKIELARGLLRARMISRGDTESLAESDSDSDLPAEESWESADTRLRRRIVIAAIWVGAIVIGVAAYYFFSRAFAPSLSSLPTVNSPTVTVVAKPTPSVAMSSACPKGCEEPPAGCLIKGNVNTTTGEKIYHLPSGKFYDATVISPRRGERWFCTEEEARANGWRKSDQ